MKLNVADFQDFYRDVHGFPPFKWQQRLLEEVLSGGWPGAIDLPTGAGKTSVLDIAVFALALQADQPMRTSPIRIALVVDRRIVVDGSFEHASKIVSALKKPRTPVLQNVADALNTFGGDVPLEAKKMRGGLATAQDSIDSPVQPLLIVSTVDQVGSRLLHRGYGLSANSQPIQAGLLGEDALIILDEAHCSRPFEETLRAVQEYRKQKKVSLGLPWGFVSMTATPASSVKNVFELSYEEREEPLLAQRITASKPASLQPLKVDEKGLPKALFRLIKAGHWIEPGKFLLVVVNRVRTARGLFSLLQEFSESPKSKCKFTPALLFGRVRPLDRDHVISRYMHAMRSGRESSESTEALVVVATQCVEVGADLDADFLISQVCPLDCLKQRFGRLNRLGRRTGCRAAIFASKADQKPDENEPVYGAALGNTWNWLNAQVKALSNGGGSSDPFSPIKGQLKGQTDKQQTIDMGIDGLFRLQPDTDILYSKKKSAPILLPSHLDLLAETNPAPSFQTPVELFLHGRDSSPAGIRFVWRRDLVEGEEEGWLKLVELCPPLSSESLPVSFALSKIWLRQQCTVSPAENKALQKELVKFQAAESDIEGQPREDASHLEQPEESHKAVGVIWRGKDSLLLRADQLGEIRPGDTIVIPAVSGGADAYGWTGASEDVPEDIAEEASLQAEGGLFLRISSSLTEQFWGTEAELCQGWNEWSCYQVDDEEGFPELEAGREIAGLLPLWLKNAEKARDSGSKVPEFFISVLKAFCAKPLQGLRVLPHPSGKGVILFKDQAKVDSSSHKLPLGRHLTAVEIRTERYAEKLHLPSAVKEALSEAARLHDIGKAYPRFQLMLAGGNPLQFRKSEPLAKSDGKYTLANDYLYKRSGIPQGFRHELLSSRMAENYLGSRGPEFDKNLALHLIESHHGRARPFAPYVEDSSPVDISFKFEGSIFRCCSQTNLGDISSGVSDRFEICLKEYGWWGTSFLEAVLRLADRKASEKNEGAEQ